MRLCDEAGINLDEEVRKQVAVSKKDLKELRAKYKKKQDGSKEAAEKKGWKPEDDVAGKWEEKL